MLGNFDDGVLGEYGVYGSGLQSEWTAMVDSSPCRTGWQRRRWSRHAEEAQRLWATRCSEVSTAKAMANRGSVVDCGWQRLGVDV